MAFKFHIDLLVDGRDENSKQAVPPDLCESSPSFLPTQRLSLGLIGHPPILTPAEGRVAPMYTPPQGTFIFLVVNWLPRVPGWTRGQTDSCVFERSLAPEFQLQLCLCSQVCSFPHSQSCLLCHPLVPRRVFSQKLLPWKEPLSPCPALLRLPLHGPKFRVRTHRLACCASSFTGKQPAFLSLVIPHKGRGRARSTS